jgi:hypothetical protein
MCIKKFVIFDNHHVVPVDDVCPESIKEAAAAAKSAFHVKLTTAQNHIAKTLGFRGGFSGYKAEWEEKLSGFLREHGLITRKDVLRLKHRRTADQFIRLEHRQIADRLFTSGRPAPKRIFVGVNVFDLLRAVAATDDFKVSEDPDSLYIAYDEIKRAEISEEVPPYSYFICSRSAGLRILEAGEYFNNLIEDQLCDFGANINDVKIVANLYGVSEKARKEIKTKTREVAALFPKILPLCPAGWVEVIRYNDNLAFLKAPDGGYDFVFRNLRDIEFEEKPDKFNTWLYFEYKDWLEADRHAAENEFHANGGTGYSHPGVDEILKSYLIGTGRYDDSKRTRSSRRSGFRLAKCPDGALCFSDLVTVKEFKEFLRVNPGHVRWRERCGKEWGSLDSLGHLDNESPEFPAAVTWYDAMAYAKWYGKRHKIPVRLLGEEEWRFLAGELIPETITLKDKRDALIRPLCEFYDPDGVIFDKNHPLHIADSKRRAAEMDRHAATMDRYRQIFGENAIREPEDFGFLHPPYMDESEFQRWQFRYKPNSLELKRSKSGLEVVRSVRFGEWLLQPEGAAINGLFGESQYEASTIHASPKSETREKMGLSATLQSVSARRAPFPPRSTGKYRDMKIGFRLVYDAEVKK